MDVKFLIKFTWFILCFLSASILPGYGSESENDYQVKSTQFMFIRVKNESDVEYVIKELSAKTLTLLSKISSVVYLFQDRNYHVKRESISNSFRHNKILTSKIEHYDQAREYVFSLSPTNESLQSISPQLRTARTVRCQTYFDMGVEHAWEKGYTGKGVIVAVTDVGVNKDIPDLKNNWLKEFSYDYIHNNADVTPDECNFDGGFYTEQDHGNRCAGVIAAENNEQCGTGIGYDANIIVVKCFGLIVRDGKCSMYFPEYSMAQALIHALDEVDIYSNSWGSQANFIPVQTGVTEAIKTGIEKGRDGKGAIYVFPVGKLADPYANSIYTIAVNGVGKDGTVPPFSETCACTLTSAYGEGSKVRNLVSLQDPHDDVGDAALCERHGRLWELASRITTKIR